MNMFVENLRLAISSLRSNKSRTFLTMLGIIIGIAAVIAIKTVGNSLTLSVSDSMQSMGANNITVYLTQRDTKEDKSDDGIVFGTIPKSKSMTRDEYFTDEMITGLIDEFPDAIEAVSVNESVGSTTVKKGTASKRLNVTGVSLGYFKANEVKLIAGSSFSRAESVGAKNVILVGSDFIDSLYDGNYAGAIGQNLTMMLNNQTLDFVITGVYEYEQSMFGIGSGSSAYIPLTTAQDINNTRNYSGFSVVSKVGVDSDSFANRIKDYLNGYYRSNLYFEVGAYSMATMVSALGDMMGKITTAISVIAGIALLVGGIGVMNIMLVSITERTREIGTRKALGATNGYIRMQFIIEAVVICIIGGVIGILLGLGMGAIGAKIMGFAASPSVSSIVGAITFSMFVGIFFGYYPANKAAKMNPIDALRYE